MTEPLNYTSAFDNLPSPVQAFTQGLQSGAMVNDLRLKQQQQQVALQQAQQMRSDLQSLMANPTPQAIGAMSIKYPQLSESLKRSADMIGPDQRQTQIDQAIPVYAAVLNGATDVATSLLNKQAAAYRNSGDEQRATGAETMAKLITDHPEFAKANGGLWLSNLMGPEKFVATFGGLGGERRAEDQSAADLLKKQSDARKGKAEADVAEGTVPALIKKPTLQNEDIESQIADRSKRLALDQDKLTTETQIKLTELKQKFGELPEFITKDVNSAATEAIAAQQSAARMNSLADQIDKASGELGGGITAKTGELWKKTFGSQNELTRIRAEYSRIVTPAAMAAYKQVASGSTSDKDIETAMVGVPKDTDSPERMAAFLRGAAKLQQYDTVLNNAKSEWLGEVKGLGKAKTDIEIDGVKVPAGTTFKQFTDSYVQSKIKSLDTQSIKGRSYMRFAQPSAPALGTGFYQPGAK